MSLLSSITSALSIMALNARAVWADDPANSQISCVSYGMDFQNGGSYFQNSLSTDNFTFVTQYDGRHAPSPLALR